MRRFVIEQLARNHALIRYDARGNGLSDWDVNELSLEAWVRDLEIVIDAAGLDRFALLGQSQGCAISIFYAGRHPERVTKLVLLGGFARGGYRRSPEEREQRKAMGTLMRLGVGCQRACISSTVYFAHDARRQTASKKLATERPAPSMTAQRTVFQASARSSAFLTATPTAQLLLEGCALALMSVSPSRDGYSNTPVRSLIARHP